MISFFSYKKKLKETLALRDQEPPLRIGWLVALLVSGVLSVIILAVAIAPEGKPTIHFEEGGLATTLSGIFLSMTSGFAALCFLLKLDHDGWSRYFWLMAALGFLFFSLDEFLQFHERVGRWIGQSDIGAPTTFRNWNDVIVIAYGVVAVVVMGSFLTEILRYPKVMGLLAIAFGFYCIHTLIDSTQQRSSLSITLEESAKLFASAFFALSMFVSVLAIVASCRSSDR